MRLVLVLGLLASLAFGEWQMFADKQETYLYNTTTGEVYVKHKRGKENYNDVFVKMPKGVASIEELEGAKATKPSKSASKSMSKSTRPKEMQEDSAKLFQEGGMQGVPTEEVAPPQEIILPQDGDNQAIEENLPLKDSKKDEAKAPKAEDKSQEDLRLESIKKAQEMMRKSLEDM